MSKSDKTDARKPARKSAGKAASAKDAPPPPAPKKAAAYDADDLEIPSFLRRK